MHVHNPKLIGQLRTKHTHMSKLSAFHFCIFYMYCNPMHVSVGAGNVFLETTRQCFWNSDEKLAFSPIQLFRYSEVYSSFYKALT